ncbi:methyl-accepting chemotaxis protein [Paenibacillus sp. ClWae2A]|uniref:methyl-accepting chemotaxis protein n=1 Tax=Paenibacillus sp. ClWae2A TaxID=3057177 RepID=UPI0028F5572F|nr:methyl-accepting chemotaxis protein [Paenibacillus sp. ClWae2A]MDT9719057.1 methyl-accepting chemotaxis protein [Paenibacillus sp. ClWae2A]
MPMLLEVKPDQPHVVLHSEELITSEMKHSEVTVVAEEPVIHLQDYYRQVPVAGVHTTCGEAATMMNQDQEHPCIVLCDEQMKPTGLLMRETLYRMLNGRFAADLFYRKPVIQVVNTSPVIADIHMEASTIIDIALGRNEQHFYDCLLVTDQGILLGVLTMRDVMSLSRRLQQASSAERVRTVSESRQEISRINDAVTKLVHAANQTVHEAREIMALSKQGEESLKHVDASYNRVNQHMESQGQHADHMLNSIKTGSGMAQSIRSLADQSGLLALNASIEAAHAGEYGRGFQIVAGEIRALAKQTRDVAGNMSSLLENIGGLTLQTVELVKASGAEIDDSSVHVTAGGATFRQLNSAVRDLSRIAEEIAMEGGKAGEVAEHIRTKLDEMVSNSE